MTEPRQDEDFLERLSARAEEALGKVAEELISNPVVNGAISRAFEAREKAIQAQVTAMGALNLPSAADIERVTRRLRSLSQRLEGIEDAIDRLEERVEAA
jgi:chromosome segregation ATPase